MNLPVEILIALNVAGWTLACWLGKRWFDALSDEIKTMASQFHTVVTRAECRGIHNRIHQHMDEVDTKVDNHGERLARVEVVADK